MRRFTMRSAPESMTVANPLSQNIPHKKRERTEDIDTDDGAKPAKHAKLAASGGNERKASLSPAKGLLDLPSELRNLIYEIMCAETTHLAYNPTATPSVCRAFAFAQVSQQIRKEFRSLLLQSPIEICFDDLGRFLEQFHPETYENPSGQDPPRYPFQRSDYDPISESNITVCAPVVWQDTFEGDVYLKVDILPLFRLMIEAEAPTQSKKYKVTVKPTGLPDLFDVVSWSTASPVNESACSWDKSMDPAFDDDEPRWEDDARCNKWWS